MICSKSYSSSETDLALSSGPHILRPVALWTLGQDSLVILLLEDAGLALFVQASQDKGMISGTPRCGV